MSAQTSHPITSRPVAAPLPHLTAVVRLAQFLEGVGRRFKRAYAAALREETSRRNLKVLDDRMLSDIGISRAQAQFEADRKPWHLL